MTEKTEKVYPSPKLSDTEYIPGVSPDGSEIPAARAKALHDAGLVVKTKPAAPADKPEDKK